MKAVRSMATESLCRRWRFFIFIVVIAGISGPALAEPHLGSVTAGDVGTVHALSLYDTPALPEDFTHFPHVNPDAPKGGSMVRTPPGGSFDSTNPFSSRAKTMRFPGSTLAIL